MKESFILIIIYCKLKYDIIKFFIKKCVTVKLPRLKNVETFLYL